jgi:hypothetical protein
MCAAPPPLAPAAHFLPRTLSHLAFSAASSWLRPLEQAVTALGRGGLKLLSVLPCRGRGCGAGKPVAPDYDAVATGGAGKPDAQQAPPAGKAPVQSQPNGKPTNGVAGPSAADEKSSGGRFENKRISSDVQYDTNQKTLDERIRDGEMDTRNRRGGVSADGGQSNVDMGEAAANARARFEARLTTAHDNAKPDGRTRARLSEAIEKSILFSGMSEEQKEMIIDVPPPRDANRCEPTPTAAASAAHTRAADGRTAAANSRRDASARRTAVSGAAAPCASAH